jgi:hypothetical protein
VAKAKKKTKKKAAAKKGAPKESLVVGAKVKNLIKDANCFTAGDALEGLNDLVYAHVDQAIKRAGANKRKTVKKYDFSA